MALMGILYAGPLYDANCEIIKEAIPTSKRSYTSTAIPINLGYIIKASQLLGFKPYIQKIIDNQKK